MESLPPLESVRMQLQAFLDEINRLKGSEFPHAFSQQALEKIEGYFRRHFDYLNLLSEKNDPAVIYAACDAAYTNLEVYLPLLGFILRSTNTRNAFEVHGPILRMAQQVLGSDTKLIVSSEWEFSPFTYVAVPQLTNFVLIGLPATESTNPLLIPLAGHELGHTIWAAHSCDDLYREKVERTIIEEIGRRWKEYSVVYPGIKQAALETDIFARNTWAPSSDWAMKQIQEMLCDFVGLRIFGESYLYAFSYLISPQRTGIRPVRYPNMLRRVAGLIKAGTKYGLQIPSNYSTSFKDLSEPTDSERQGLQLSISDVASDSVVDLLIEKADELITGASIEARSDALVSRCLNYYRLMVPAQQAESLSNIVNAAWQALLIPKFFGSSVSDDRRIGLLFEIVLKSCEVFEIEQLMKGKA